MSSSVFDVGRDVLAHIAVAARRPGHKRAVLVAQGHRQAVDLRLGAERDLVVLAETQETADAADEVDHVLRQRTHCRARASAARGGPWRIWRREPHRPGGSASPTGPGPETAPRWRHCVAAADRIRRRRPPAHLPGNSACHGRRSRRPAASARPWPAPGSAHREQCWRGLWLASDASFEGGRRSRK